MSNTASSSLRLGTWLSVGSPVIAELAAECALDWVLFDLEHGCASESALPDQLRALRGSPTAGVVRVGAPHADLIARVLDWGAHGLMVPHVNSAEEARQIVRAAHYAPRGQRGYSRTVRAHGYGLRVPGDSPPPSIIMAQIETLHAVECAAEIAAVEGVDVLFVGPADLGFDLKARQSARSEDECLVEVIAAAKQHGKASGILVRRPEDLEKMKALGFAWLAVDSDIGILRAAYQALLRRTGSTA